MFVLAQVVFWPRTQRAATSGRVPDSPLEFTSAATAHRFYLHLSCYSSHYTSFHPFTVPFSASLSSPCSLSFHLWT